MPVESDWVTQLEAAVAEAAPAEGSQFWETGVTLPDDLVPIAAMEIAKEVSAGTTRRGQGACLFLFHLLRTRLTNVRANRLWPEVANALAELSGLPVDSERCAQWFRSVLLSYHEDAMDDVHNRFVACAFDEAGVGWDRFRIARDFLQYLSGVGFGEADPTERVSIELDRYRRRSPDRDDVEALSPMLKRTGVVLAEVAAHLQRGGAGSDWAIRGWDEFRAYWKERTGADLERLLPEAREILSDLIPRISGRMSRAGFIAQIRDGKIGAQFPASISVSVDHGDPRRIPLSPVLLTVGAKQKTIILCDEFGMTAEQVVQTNSDEWHRAGGNGFYCWREKAFLVSTGAFRTESGVAMLPGRDVSSAAVAGFFWSGTLQADSIPNAEGIGPVPDIGPQLRLVCSWRADDAGVSLWIERFEARFLRYSGVGSLDIGGRPSIWDGCLDEGTPTSNDAFPIQLSDFAILRGSDCVLRDSAGRQLCETRIAGPLTGDLILFVSSRLKPVAGETVVSKRQLEEPFPGGVIVCARSRMTVTGGSLDVIRRGYPMTGWQALRPHLDADAPSLAIRCGASRITLTIGQPVSMQTRSSEDAVVGDVELRGTGGLRPVTLADPMELQLNGFSRNTQRTGTLIVKMPTRQHEIPLWELPDLAECVEDESGGARFSGRSLISAIGAADSPGLIRFALSTPFGGGGQTTDASFFRIPETVAAPVAVVGSEPELTLGEGQQAVLRIVSTAPCRFEDSAERKRVSGLHHFGDGIALAARWRPVIIGAVMRDGKGTIEGSELSICDLSPDAHLRLVGPEDMETEVQIGEGRQAVKGPRTFGLRDMLGQIPPVVIDRHLNVKVVWRQRPIGAWRLDLTPTDLNVSCDWRTTAADELSLAATVTWTGLPHQAVDVTLTVDDQEVTVTLAPLTSSESQVTRFNERTTIPVGTASRAQLASGCQAKLTVGWNSIVVARQDVTPPPSQYLRPTSADSIKAQVKSLCEAVAIGKRTDDAALEELLYLMEAYFARVGSLPFPADKVIARILNAGSDHCRADVVVGLRILDALERRDEHRIPQGLPRSGGRLGVFITTLRAVAEIRASGRGLADLRTLRALSDHILHQGGGGLTHHHLLAVRSTVSRVAPLGLRIRRALSLEVRRRQVVEENGVVEVEQRTLSLRQPLLNHGALRVQSVEVLIERFVRQRVEVRAEDLGHGGASHPVGHRMLG